MYCYVVSMDWRFRDGLERSHVDNAVSEAMKAVMDELTGTHRTENEA
jgi:hypothetical protein